VSSLALGGGLELALTTHLRVFSSSALVALPETRLGIIPGAGGTYRLPFLIGRSRALDVMLTGRRINGAEAYFMGLCDRLVDVGEIEDMKEGLARGKTLQAAVELAMSICEGGPIAARQVIACAGLGEQWENAAYQKVVATKDRDEALKAFAEKRKAVYKGM
jgi:methylglutaconyl-CoA hydratase